MHFYTFAVAAVDMDVIFERFPADHQRTFKIVDLDDAVNVDAIVKVTAQVTDVPHVINTNIIVHFIDPKPKTIDVAPSPGDKSPIAEER